MSELVEPVVCQFYKLMPGAPEPRRADRSADGMLPTEAYRYCEAVASASAFGFYFFPPLPFALMRKGNTIRWTYDGASGWYPLRGAQYPGFQEAFDKLAPAALRSLAPTCLTASRHPGVVQIWSGYFARTAPGWSLLSRGPVNIPKDCEYFDGILETDTWFGPLFTNIRLARDGVPVEFHPRYPLFQVQPVMPRCYRDPAFKVFGSADLDAADWERYAATIVPNTDPMRKLGHYAVETRKRVRRQSAGSAR
jgi:hypothetical protein